MTKIYFKHNIQQITVLATVRRNTINVTCDFINQISIRKTETSLDVLSRNIFNSRTWVPKLTDYEAWIR